MTTYKKAAIEGVNVFYREAGPKDPPAIVLLHGFPSSSHMFRDLIHDLSDRFHLIAPDYPGGGHSDCPDPNGFAYTFDHLSGIVEAFLQAIGITRFSLYIQDYGGPIGFRIASRHPDCAQRPDELPKPGSPNGNRLSAGSAGARANSLTGSYV